MRGAAAPLGPDLPDCASARQDAPRTRTRIRAYRRAARNLVVGIQRTAMPTPTSSPTGT